MKPLTTIVRLNGMIGGLMAAALLGGCASDKSESPAEAPRKTAATTMTTTTQTPVGKVWSLTMVEGAEVQPRAADRRHPSLRLDPAAGRATGFAGVNQFGGPYTMDGQKLTFGNLAMTRMAGPPEAMALEQKYAAALKATTGWRIAGGKLELLAGDRVVARLE